MAAYFARNTFHDFNVNGFVIGIIVPKTMNNLIPIFFNSLIDEMECEMLINRYAILKLVAASDMCIDKSGINLGNIELLNSSCRLEDSEDAHVKYYFKLYHRELTTHGGGNGILTPYESIYNEFVEFEQSRNNIEFKNVRLIQPHKILENKIKPNFPNTYEIMVNFKEIEKMKNLMTKKRFGKSNDRRQSSSYSRNSKSPLHSQKTRNSRSLLHSQKARNSRSLYKRISSFSKPIHVGGKLSKT